jgi:hypothetical protein
MTNCSKATSSKAKRASRRAGLAKHDRKQGSWSVAHTALLSDVFEWENGGGDHGDGIMMSM